MAVPTNVIFGGVPNRNGADFGTLTASALSSDYAISNVQGLDLGLKWKSFPHAYLGWLRWSSSLAYETAFKFRAWGLVGHNLSEDGIMAIAGKSSSATPSSTQIYGNDPTSIEAGYSNWTGDGGGVPVAGEVDAWDDGDYHKSTGGGTIRYNFVNFVNVPTSTHSLKTSGFTVQFKGATNGETEDCTVELWESNVKVRTLGTFKLNGVDAFDTPHVRNFYFAPSELSDVSHDDAQLHLISGGADVWIEAVQIFAYYEDTVADDLVVDPFSVFDTYSEQQLGSPNLRDLAGEGFNWTAAHIHDSEISLQSYRVMLWNPDPLDGTTGYEPTGSSPSIEAGYLIAGPIVVPPLNMQYGYQFGVDDKSEKIEMEDGATFVIRNSRKRVAKLTIEEMTPEFALQNFGVWFDIHLGQSIPFLFRPENRDGTLSIQTFLGRLDGIESFSMPYLNKMNRTFVIREW